MKNAIALLAVTASLASGAAFAYSPADDAAVPTREIELNLVSRDKTEGNEVRLDLSSVQDPRSIELQGEQAARAYDFGSNTSSSNAAGNRYR